MREIVFDTETTGLSFQGGDRLVEIGCVELVNRVETGGTYHVYLNPQRPVPPEASAVHGLTDAFLSDKPLFGAQVDALLAFVGDAPLIAPTTPSARPSSSSTGPCSICSSTKAATSRALAV